ncbi:cytochrome c oxidase subunit II [Rhodanobacter caeni]|uniref:Cytochrome c oxidase subunit 2 n=1 Tax=Rhodanobacter caeni TaxID=657654 RepID=A0ABP3DZH4_9GAMM
MIALSPPQASSVAGSVDTLFDVMLALTGTVSVAVFVVMIVFCVKYRRRSHADRSNANQTRLGVEIAWTVLPFLMFMALFGWSISLWSRMRTPPADAAPIYVVAKQWMWKVQHPGGQREIDSLHVPLGQPIRLVMTSQDVIHSFYVPAFRQKQDVLPGRYTQLWFTATREGDYPLLCSQYCGTDHARMTGTVTVMKPADYARWLQAHAGQGLAEQGAERFRRFGCSGCHDSQSGVHAPDLDGLYGSTVPLADGSQVRADDRYIHDSIMLPRKQVAAGYAPIMPSYSGRIGEDDVLALIAYIKSRRTAMEAAREQH